MPNDASPVRNATAADSAAISHTLALAFHDDPVKAHLIGGRSVSAQKVTPFFTAFQKIQLPHGHVYTTHGHEAAALWAPPGQWKIPFSQVVRNTPTFLKLYGWRLAPNLGVLSTLEKAHEAQAPEPHYYLEFLGTHPDHRGKGFAAALMQPMMDRADEEGVGMYLENSKEQNKAFYGRFGFEVRREITLRKGPSMWLMWRAAR